MRQIGELVNIVRSNPDAMVNLVQHSAEEVVSEIARRGLVEGDKLVRAILETRWPPMLLAAFVRNSLQQPQQLKAAALALFESGEEALEAFDRSDLRHIAELFDRANLFGLLADKHQEVLTDQDHPLFSLLSSEKYWEMLIISFLGHGDHRRAWEEAKHALRGFRPKGAEPQNIREHLEMPEPDDSTHQVSTPTFGRMVRQIFDDMVAKKLLEPEITDESCKLHNFDVKVRRYPGMRKDSKRVPKPADTTVVAAGTKYAKRFVAREFGYNDPIRYVLAPEGVMILRIAGYFAAKDAEGSRAKWLELCRKHSVDPATLEN